MPRLPFLLLMALSFPVSAQPPAPMELTVSEGFRNPLGYHDALPTFSWKLADERPGARQTAYHITATDGADTVLWDSGKVESDQSVYLPWGGTALKSRNRVEWSVRYWDQDGVESPPSAFAHFEMGLLDNADWQAKWIHPPLLDDAEATLDPVPCFRREFSLEHDVAEARVYVTARGIFELTINGHRVGDDHFAPGWTNYDKKIETLTYDVTDLLQSGPNVIGARVARGWYASGMMNGAWGQVPQLLLQLEVRSPAGAVTTVASDEKWSVSLAGPITYATIYGGEDYDARQELAGWNLIGGDGRSFEPVSVSPIGDTPLLRPKRFRTVRRTEFLPSVSVREVEPGRAIFDLGQNMVGVPEISLPGLADQQITVSVAEMLNPDGSLYRDNYRSARSLAYYLPAEDGGISYAPAFTFFGFRYVEVSGYDPSFPPELSWVRGHVWHTDFPATGTFTSSHETLNQLNQNIRWGLRGNFLEIPTDCPQRNERLGWTGDAQVFAPVALFHYDTHAFWASWLESMRIDQHEDGSVPHVIPAGPRFADWVNSPGWGDAMFIIPWQVYVATGDRRLLAENYDAMKLRFDWYHSRADNHLQTMDRGFGDWLQPVMYHGEDRLVGEDTRWGETTRDFLATCYYGYGARIMANAAAVLERNDEARYFDRVHQDVRAAVTVAYFDAEGKLTLPVETQTGYVLPVAFDLIDSLEMQTKVTNAFVDRLARDGNRLNTGFLGTSMLTTALHVMGRPDLANHLVFSREYPGWMFSIDQGATTIWERWNSYTHADGFGDASMNSFNHYAYGAVGQYLYERFAGIRPDPASPGYRHVVINPVFTDHPLTEASAQLETRYGLVSNTWERDGDDIVMTTRIPPNASGTIVLPFGTEPIVEQGTCEFQTLKSTGTSAAVPAGIYRLRFQVP